MPLHNAQHVQPVIIVKLRDLLRQLVSAMLDIIVLLVSQLQDLRFSNAHLVTCVKLVQLIPNLTLMPHIAQVVLINT